MAGVCHLAIIADKLKQQFRVGKSAKKSNYKPYIYSNMYELIQINLQCYEIFLALVGKNFSESLPSFYYWTS
jgi:hypothetical protein